MIRSYFAIPSVVFAIAAAALLANRSQPLRTPAAIDSTKTLKDEYASYFTMGVSVAPRNLRGEEAFLIKEQFNSLTAENAMKMGPLHPEENRYHWKDADSIVAFAEKNGMKIRGHALVWHHQQPDWIFSDGKGETVSREKLLQRLKEHITTVIKKYKGKVYAWDVVNEAISDHPGEYLRPTPWLQIIGEEYIAKAFQWAHEADPDALLFYNDYNELEPVKREKIFKLVKKLKDDGVPIHGVGLQAHWSVQEFSPVQLEMTLKMFAQLGLQLQITELDLSLYPKKGKQSPSVVDFSAQQEKQQALAYKDAFRIFRRYRDHITGITFWNLSDRHSWLDNFPVKGRKDYPLLFDKDLQPKQAFWEVINWRE